jgi:hypothetical protein
VHKDRNVIGIPPVTRLLRIVRIDGGWQVWTGARHEFRIGSYLQLNNDGSVFNVTVRSDEGDESYCIRPSDREVNDE